MPLDTINVIKTVDDLSQVMSFENNEEGQKAAENLFLTLILPYCLDQETGVYDTDQFVEDGFMKIMGSSGVITVQLTVSMDEIK